MRITAFIMLVLATHLSAKTVSQTVSFKGKNVPFTRVVAEIKQQTGFAIAYNPDVIAKARPVTIDVKDVPLKDFLEQIVVNQPFGFLLEGNTIFISPKATTAELSPGNSAKKDPPITGIVRGPDGQPLAGVNVVIKGTKIGTVTDKDGRFSIDAEEGSMLEISSIGFGKKIIMASPSMLEISLEISSSELDEVQYIAYGQTSKRFNVGNISSVKATDIERHPVQNPLLALQGRVPGLLITQSNGIPGGGVTVRIQGLNSIGNGTDPLYVIDGVPFTSQLLPNLGSLILGTSGGPAVNNTDTYGSPLNYINPLDIESIVVLKDAEATAIYGSRAANGAILITTKSAKVGKTNVNFNIQSGYGKVARRLNVLNLRQYLDMRYEAFKNDGATEISPGEYDMALWDTTRYTDWQEKLIGGTAKYTTIYSALTGGTSNTKYLLSGTYHRETSVFPDNFSDRRGSMHFNLNNTSNDQRLRVQLNINYLVDNNQLPGVDVTNTALTLSPNSPALYNPDGTLNWMHDASGNATWTNPLSYTVNRYTQKTNNLIGNVDLSYFVFKNLELKSSFGYTNMRVDEVSIAPSVRVDPSQWANYGIYLRQSNFAYNTIKSWIVEPQTKYKNRFGKLAVEILLGATFQDKRSDGVQLGSFGYNSDKVLEDIRSASNISVISNMVFDYRYSALFGRINLNLANKYLLNINARRDGSSRFGANNQFHNFGSIGTGWLFSEENWMKNNFPFISFGKIKASYGTTGSDQINDYSFLNLYSPVTSNVGVPYQGITAVEPVGIPNPYIQWEQTRKLSVGLDLGVMSDKIIFSANYFHNQSSNQLLSYVLPVTTGFDRISRNFPATVRNTGLEFTLNTNASFDSFNWTASLNMTLPDNKLLSFLDLESSSYASTLVIGQSINIQKVYHFRGVDPSTGVYQFGDSKGGTTSRPDTAQALTKNLIIDRLPKFYGGIYNNFSFKGFELDFLFQVVKQFGPNYAFGVFPGAGINQPAWILERWQKPGDEVPIQRFNSDFSLYQQVNSAMASDRSWSDASYVRLKNISLGWQLPSELLKHARIDRCKLYVQGQNLLTITNYKGLDPETLSINILPPLKVVVFGVQVGL